MAKDKNCETVLKHVFNQIILLFKFIILHYINQKKNKNFRNILFPFIFTFVPFLLGSPVPPSAFSNSLQSSSLLYYSLLSISVNLVPPSLISPQPWYEIMLMFRSNWVMEYYSTQLCFIKYYSIWYLILTFSFFFF